MFTGLVQSMGQLQQLNPYQLEVLCRDKQDPILEGIALGDSISVDGVCLTVEEILPQGFIVSVSPETLAKSTLGATKPDTWVNLETSLRVGSKIGGHFVTGHVDGLGYLASAQQTATSWDIEIAQVESNVARYIVSKGSIAVNGISLTIASCSASGDRFSVAVIPVTYAETNLQYLSPGSPVNLEGDVLGKYVEKFLKGGSGAIAQEAVITPEFLTQHGYVSRG